MIADCLSALARRPMRRLPSAGGKVRFGRLLMQGVATSLDALAVGVTLLAAEASGALPMPPPLCAAAIGVVTFVLSLGAVSFGRRVGTAFADTAGVLGGAVLIGIGVKLLFEGIF